MIFYVQFSSLLFLMYMKVNLDLYLIRNNSSFSRRNCITNQTSDKFDMVKGSKKLSEAPGFFFCGLQVITCLFLSLFKVHFQNGQLSVLNIDWQPNTDSGQCLVHLHLETQNEFRLSAYYFTTIICYFWNISMT